MILTISLAISQAQNDPYAMPLPLVSAQGKATALVASIAQSSTPPALPKASFWHSQCPTRHTRRTRPTSSLQVAKLRPKQSHLSCHLLVAKCRPSPLNCAISQITITRLIYTLFRVSPLNFDCCHCGNVASSNVASFHLGIGIGN